MKPKFTARFKSEQDRQEFKIKILQEGYKSAQEWFDKKRTENSTKDKL